MKFFFHETRDAAKQFSELFDFVWATAPALWNLRWQVDGFLKAVPNASPTEIAERFVFGSGIHGSNLRKACVDTSWEDQKSQFASIILTSAFSIYEYWADSILINFRGHRFTGKALQFDGAGGVHGVVSHLCATESAVLKRSYYPVFSKSQKFSQPNMPNLLKCYRYFKEGRNSQVHGGGKASQRAQQAYADFSPASDRRSLGIRGALVHEPFIEGQAVRLHLRGVVGFCDVLLKIMTTVDAELCRSIQSEAFLETILRDVSGQPNMLSANGARRNKQVLKRCTAAGLPKPADPQSIYDFMRSKHIISV